MADQFSNFSLTMLNLWIGMCRGVAGLPRNLRELGYSEKWIEYPFQIAKGEAVEPDLMLCSDRTRHTLLLEWKAGPNAEH